MPTPAPPLRTPSAARRRPRRRLARAGAAALLAAGAGLAAAGPAAAHDRLESTNPGDGAVVDVAPATVVLTMSSTPIALGTQVQVKGPDGQVVSSGDPRIVDATVTEPLTGALPAGTYEVQWRITSSDGHPVSGTFSFTASGAASGASPPSSASSSSSSSSSAGSDATSPATVDPSNPVAGQGDSTLIGVGIAVVVVVGGIGGVIGYRRRRR